MQKKEHEFKVGAAVKILQNLQNCMTELMFYWFETWEDNNSNDYTGLSDFSAPSGTGLLKNASIRGFSSYLKIGVYIVDNSTLVHHTEWCRMF